MPLKTTSLEAYPTIGIDIGKNTFHLIGLDKMGAIILRQKLSRNQVDIRLVNMPRCLIGMGSAPRGHSLALLRASRAGRFTHKNARRSWQMQESPLSAESNIDGAGQLSNGLKISQWACASRAQKELSAARISSALPLSSILNLSISTRPQPSRRLLKGSPLRAGTQLRLPCGSQWICILLGRTLC